MNYYAKIAEKRNDTVKRGNLSYGRYEIKKEKESFSTKGFAYVGYVYSDDGSVSKTAPRESIEECESDIRSQKTFKAYTHNSKEEKDNSTVARGTVHGHKYEVDRMSDGSYMGYVYDEEDFPIFKTGLHSTAAGAEQEIKGKVFNSKENWKVLDAEIMSYTDPSTHEKYFKVWLVTDEGWRNPRLFKTFQEADREVARIQREVKSQNSKENSMNYYEKIIAEKHNIKTVTKQDWEDAKKHGYASIINGQKYMLMADPKAGTVLAPVNVNSVSEEENEKDLENADRSEIGKYISKEELDYLEKIDFPRVYDDKAQKILNKYARLKNRDNKNTKDEKTNISERAIALAMSYLKEGWKEDKIKKEMISQYNISETQALDAIDFAKKSLNNSKETTGYYAKLAAEKRNFGDEVLIEKKTEGEYWYSIYQTKNKMILRVYTPFGMYYIDDVRDLSDARSEAKRTIDIVKKEGRFV